MKSLENDFYIKSEKQSKQFWNLTDEAKEVIKIGSPGILLFNLLYRS